MIVYGKSHLKNTDILSAISLDIPFNSAFLFPQAVLLNIVATFHIWLFKLINIKLN